MQPNYDALYRSLVTSNVDLTNSGRIRVQCPQISGIAEIRAAEPANPQDPVPVVGSTVWVGFSGGDITKPYYFANSEYVVLGTDGTTVQTMSIVSAARPDAARLLVVGGIDGTTTGNSNGPHISMRDVNADSALDVRISGSIIKTNNSGTIFTWTAATMGTGWAQGSGVGGAYPNLNWKYDAEDNIHIFGVFHATSTTPSGTLATGLPAASISGNVSPGGSAISINVSNRVLPLYVNSSGELHTPIVGTIAVNDTFEINVKVPIGNLS